MFKEPAKVIIKGTDVDGKKDMVLTYAASPKLAKTISVNLLLPQIYTEALLNYAAYKAHAAVSGELKAANNTYYLRFSGFIQNMSSHLLPQVLHHPRACYHHLYHLMTLHWVSMH